MDTIAILIPVFNEEKSIVELTNELEKACVLISNTHKVNFRIIFVDDGSSDSSVERIIQLKDHQLPIQLISLSRNFGKEAAISAGLEAGKDDSAILIMDADLQHPPALIQKLIGEYMNKNVDMVYAFKQSRKTEGLLSRLMSKIFYNLINTNSRFDIPKDAGDFRILSKKVVRSILNLPENERFMKGLYAWVGFKVKGVPYSPKKRAHGVSFFSIWKLLFLAIDGITSFSIAPLRMMSMFGLGIAILSTLYFLFIIFERLFLNTSIPGLASIFVLVSFFGGVQLICLGIIGEYIGKILLEAKKRPSYVVDKDVEISKGKNTS
ncbi:MAG: glycosyltransferase family 2 protein [Paracoccaceae bacterium]